MDFELDSQKSFAASFRESFAASDVGSDGLSSRRSRVLSGVTRSGRRSATSSRTSSVTYFDGSFPASSVGSFQRPSLRSAGCSLHGQMSLARGEGRQRL
jgi:hypothetical protein